MISNTNLLDKTETTDLFTEFFELGQEESVSPFLKPESRSWSINLTLKASILASIMLFISFVLSFWTHALPISHLFLVGVYFLAGMPSLIEAVEDLLNGIINIDILMTLAAFSSILIGSGMEGGLLLVLFALSGSMEDAVTSKAKGAISGLTKLSPTRACVVEADGTLIERAIKDIPLGARILVKAGQVVPLDGTVIEGTSSLNLVHLTGENLPVTKTVGDEVPAGGRNLDGALTIDVTRTSADSTLARIIQLVTEAQEARPALQRWFDSLSRKYAITIILLSTFFALALPFILSISFLGVEGSVYRALAFLIAASPCALIIAIPIAYLSAVSACARRGILIKGGVTLDALASCQAIAFDKTGTLTTGQLSCIKVEALLPKDVQRIDEAISVAYAMERNAVHPIATAIMKYAENKQLKAVSLNDFKAIPGYGLEATYNNSEAPSPQTVYIGRPSYIANKLPTELQAALLERTAAVEEDGELLAVLVIDHSPFVFQFRDTPRANIAQTIRSIEKRGLSTVMLTGDHAKSARRIAEELAITEYHADLTPEDKLNYVSELASKKGLAMIGDGVNDAPALARATVGICMGKVGNTAAVEAADVVLLQDNIELLDWLISKAKLTQQIVKQNLALATIAIICASLPALGGFIPLWLAVIMHEGGTVLVGLNALRLLRN
ncbi:MAG: cation-translocating P-type ATPase [Parachlamydiaceae bacterium]|nr:cation-translocating P-type ATPase [Parachlamydiaceae bacterium]